MKTWKTIIVVIVAFAIIGASVATAFAFGFGLHATTPYTPNVGATSQYTTAPNGLTTTPPTITQNLPPVTQTNTQTPTLYTPSNIVTIQPGYSTYGGWGGCGMMGSGMMGRWGYGTQYPNTGTTTAITINQAAQIATTYVTSLNNPDLKVTQVEEYTANFYVQVNEVSTGYGAFQLLINKVTGVVTPEMGPNMMWNTKYTFGMGYCNWFRGTATTAPTITLDQAKANTQQYLNAYLPGTTVGDVTTFYGYYNVEVLNAGTTYGMLSVNAYTGQVWYHTWHGTFIQELQVS